MCSMQQLSNQSCLIRAREDMRGLTSAQNLQGACQALRQLLIRIVAIRQSWEEALKRDTAFGVTQPAPGAVTWQKDLSHHQYTGHTEMQAAAGDIVQARGLSAVLGHTYPP